MNKVILSGNLGKDPKALQFSNGGSKASFQLAVDRAYREKEVFQKEGRKAAFMVVNDRGESLEETDA